MGVLSARLTVGRRRRLRWRRWWRRPSPRPPVCGGRASARAVCGRVSAPFRIAIHNDTLIILVPTFSRQSYKDARNEATIRNQSLEPKAVQLLVRRNESPAFEYLGIRVTKTIASFFYSAFETRVTNRIEIGRTSIKVMNRIETWWRHFSDVSRWLGLTTATLPDVVLSPRPEICSKTTQQNAFYD